jgi:serine protease Do
VITLAAGKVVSTPDDVRKAVADAKRDGHKAVLFEIERNGSSQFVAVPLLS